ncbi:hypothetical protein C8D89_13010 [Actinomycetospora cinnamomea]|uniref:Uncharacterized protein n=1 Tax=Actinomycetospora cinnamomea TaxID=663609 RepID=A0A2U1E8Y5_9PSEU|nr:hypothetical protein C8D89_13010 [Actinomycetospora cinnamomea]
MRALSQGVSLAATLVLAFLVVLTLGACSPRGPQEVDLEEMVSDFVAANPGEGEDHYRAPTAPEARALVEAVDLARNGDIGGAARLLGPLDHVVREVRDEATGRRLLLVTEQPVPSAPRRHGWGLFVVAPQADRGPLIEVPHPAADRQTELLGVDVFRSLSGSALLVAGAHRSATPDADVAHEPDTAFHAVHDALVAPGQTVVQVHGFDGDDHPRHYGDTVVSDGAHEGGPPSPTSMSLTSALEGAGFQVCLQHRDRCDRLAATQNLQGRSARAMGGQFVHLEVEASIRSDPVGRRRLADVTAFGLRED